MHEDDNSSGSPRYEVRRYIQSLLQDASDPQTVLPLFDVLHGTKHHKGVSDLNKSGNIILQEL